MIPSYPLLTYDEQVYIVKIIKKFISTSVIKVSLVKMPSSKA
jgi:hypothetical protein